jgi:hypothetical protein
MSFYTSKKTPENRIALQLSAIAWCLLNPPA